MKKMLCIFLLVALVLTSISFTAFAEEEIIITSADSRCVMKGSDWKESTSESVSGPTGGTSWYTRDFASTATYDASGLAAGNYGVYLYVTPWGGTADKVDVTITTSSKITVVTTDGVHGGKGNRHWIFLGKYDFAGSVGESVTQQINKNSSEGAMRTSGVKFVKDDTNTADIDKISIRSGYVITVDDSRCKLKGNGWTESTNANVFGPLDGHSWYTRDTKASAEYDASWLMDGDYGVYIYMTPYGTTYDEIDVRVTASGETTSFSIAGLHGGEGNRHWMFLGKYHFNGSSGDKLVHQMNRSEEALKANTNGVMRTSAVKFVKDDTNTAKVEKFDPNSRPKNPIRDSVFLNTDLHIVERMGMLIGEGEGVTEEYINKTPTRVQAAIMVLRLNGVDAEATVFKGKDNFADCDLEPWAKPYLAYLKAHPEFGLVGTGDNLFNPSDNISEQAYAKILLTALGYEYNVDFTWDKTLEFAKKKGIAQAESNNFTIKDLAIMTESILDLKCKDGSSYFTSLIARRDGVGKEVYGFELPEDMKALRDESRSKKRFVFNNDGNDVYKSYPEYPGAYDISHLDGKTINAENFLKARTYGLEDTQVTTVTYNTGVFNSCHHESTGITDVRVRDWARALKQYTGKDSLETMADYVHSVGREIFFSMRVNDTHDYAYEQHELDPWKLANPEKLMFKKAEKASWMKYGGGRWSAADYTYKEVRQLVYDVYRDVLERYDVDGIEIDFTRHPLYFREVTMGYDVYPENIERMNNLIRALRDLTEKMSVEKGKPILISIIVPDSIDFCYDIGLDIRTWCEEGLIDLVALGSSHPGIFQHIKDAIAEYDDFDVAVHANLDKNTYNTSKMSVKEINHKEAALAYDSGADGISLYNQFNIKDEIYDTLGMAETAGELDPEYVHQRKTPSGSGYCKNQKNYVKNISVSTSK